jgi:site-specific DNA-methyltransferase (adenine-specific)
MTQPYSLHTGDCLEVLKTLDAESVDAIVTDPPYGLAFMGKKWDYDVPSTDIWQECLRVLKPGGHLLAFAGTRTQHRMACRIEDAGFEIRDMIAWVYGSGFPKSHNLKDDWQGWGTALKPALEPITVARKPLIGTVAENVLEHGTGALNIDGCRVEAGPDYEAAGFGPRYGHTSGNRAHGDSRPWIAQKIANGVAVKNSEPHTQGRWPANFIHDGSDEVVGLFPQSKSTGGQASLGAFRNGDVYGKGRDEREARDPGFGDSGSAARFFYCAKASKADRDEGCEGLEAKVRDAEYRQPTGDPLVDRLHGCGEPRRNHHPTVKPTDLMAYLCRLITPPNGTILDPFTGSGSTGVAALREGFKFIGIELNPEYVEIAQKRIENELNKAPLFANA